MRDITLGNTIYMDFTTRAFATGVPTLLAGSPVLSVLEENNATPITAGVSVSVSRGSVAGLNMATIVATGGNGFETGKGYSVYISTGTVGGVSVVGEIIGQFTVEKSAAYIRIGAPAGASVSADIAAIEAQTDDIGVAGAGLTAINLPDQTMNITGNITGNLSGTVGSVTGAVGSVAGNVDGSIGSLGVTAKTDVNAECDTALVGYDAATGAEVAALNNLSTAQVATELATYDGPTKAEMDTAFTEIKGATWASGTDTLEALRDRGDAAWTTGAGGSDRLLMVDTTIATLASQTSFTLTAGSADDKAYRNCTIVIEDASTATQKAIGLVSTYVGATKTITLKYDPGVFTIATTDKVYILAENALKSTAANRQLDVTAAGNAGIDWGNVENKGAAVDLAATDIQLVDTATVNSDMVAEAPTTAQVNAQCDLAISDAALATAANLATVDGIVDNILIDTETTIPGTITTLQADTDDIQTRLPAVLVGGRMDCTLDATGMEVGAIDAIFQRQMTESYNVDGTAPTLEQALMLTLQSLTEFSISGTTITAKKLDGAATAATYTLDSDTNPTSRTRAT